MERLEIMTNHRVWIGATTFSLADRPRKLS